MFRPVIRPPSGCVTIIQKGITELEASPAQLKYKLIIRLLYQERDNKIILLQWLKYCGIAVTKNE